MSACLRERSGSFRERAGHDGVRLIEAMRRPLIGRAGPGEFAALAMFSMFLAAIDAFDTGELPAALRCLYWLMALGGGGMIAALIEPFLARPLGDRPVLLAAAQLAAMTPPIAAWVSVIPVVMFGSHASAEPILPLLLDVMIVNVAVIALALSVRRIVAPAARPAASDGVAPPDIRTRLPPRLARSRLVAVQAEDHYLRIRTQAGSALVLMRLSDALAALKGADGLRVHRSWWVARAAVEAARWRGGRGELVLSDGAVAPVSRTYAAGLRDTDWATPVG